MYPPRISMCIVSTVKTPSSTNGLGLIRASGCIATCKRETTKSFDRAMNLQRLVERSRQKIHHQPDRGLSGAAAGIAIRIHLYNI